MLNLLDTCFPYMLDADEGLDCDTAALVTNKSTDTSQRTKGLNIGTPFVSLKYVLFICTFYIYLSFSLNMQGALPLSLRENIGSYHYVRLTVVFATGTMGRLGVA